MRQKGILQISNPTANVSFSVVGKEPWDENNLLNTKWKFRTVNGLTELSTHNIVNVNTKLTIPSKGIEYAYTYVHLWNTYAFVLNKSSEFNTTKKDSFTVTNNTYQQAWIYDSLGVLTSYGNIMSYGAFEYYVEFTSRSTNTILINWMKANAELISW